MFQPILANLMGVGGIRKSWEARKFYVVGYGEVENILLRLIFKGNINFLNIHTLNMI